VGARWVKRPATEAGGGGGRGEACEHGQGEVLVGVGGGGDLGGGLEGGEAGGAEGEVGLEEVGGGCLCVGSKQGWRWRSRTYM